MRFLGSERRRYGAAPIGDGAFIAKLSSLEELSVVENGNPNWLYENREMLATLPNLKVVSVAEAPPLSRKARAAIAEALPRCELRDW